ncbi:MAG: type II toxin-antitoxin system VapC family toxin [Defluviicoccus sp.]|nr:type II toxin-antitoxin system VapC family toxin [Defluviicoccus sp.]MDE0386116.1 type II toxin-antitoxin system VapC family toxin [Defluviicoccus sp.]
MTAGYVVDASVVVKWLVDEVHSTEAAELLNGGSTFVAPALVFAEAANALWAMHRRGHVGVDDLTEAVETLRTAPISLPVSMLQLTPASARLADDLDHPVYDCFYLALAVQTQYPVVTADMRFYYKVRAHPYLSDLMVHVADIGSNGTA